MQFPDTAQVPDTLSDTGADTAPVDVSQPDGRVEVLPDTADTIDGADATDVADDIGFVDPPEPREIVVTDPGDCRAGANRWSLALPDGVTTWNGPGRVLSSHVSIDFRTTDRWRLRVATEAGLIEVVMERQYRVPDLPEGAAVHVAAATGWEDSADGALWFALWDDDGLVVFLRKGAASAPFGDDEGACRPYRCPRASQVLSSECDRSPFPCFEGDGQVSYSDLRITLPFASFDLGYGATAEAVSWGEIAVRESLVVPDGCFGQPGDSYASAFALRNEGATACRCGPGGESCGAGEVCDPWSRHCVPNRCDQAECGDLACDPFTGGCFDRDGLDPCSQGDCGINEALYCDPVWEVCRVPVCEAWYSCTDLCAATGCLSCLNDCDCDAGYACVDDECVLDCDDDRLAATDASDALVQVCIPRDDPLAEATLRAIDPDFVCGFAGAYVPCTPQVEHACFAPLAASAAALSAEERLCRLSWMPFVSSITTGAAP